MKIKELYAKAQKAYEDGKAALQEIEAEGLTGADLQAKTEQVQAFFDEAERLSGQAKLLERQAGMDEQFNEPSKHLPLPGSKGDDDDEWLEMGLAAAGLKPETKALANIAGFPVEQRKLSPFNFDGQPYDPDRAIKQRFAQALYWKFGLRNGAFEKAAALLPDTLKQLALEAKDLATAPGAAGGYLVEDHVRGEFIQLAGVVSAMRRIARVLPPIPGGSTITPSEESALTDATWTYEVGTGADETVEPFGERRLTPHPLAKRIKVSRTLLRAATLLNVEAYITERMARRHAVPQEYAFINGDGAEKPLGLLTGTGVQTWETAAANTVDEIDIVNWVYSLPAAYAGAARILCNRSFIRRVRLLQDSNGAFIWQPGLQIGSPPQILDTPYEVSDQYPTGLTSEAWDNNALVATIGDFSYYWIVDSLSLEIQRLEELYAETNQVGFIGRAESDGMVVLQEAFLTLKVKSA